MFSRTQWLVTSYNLTRPSTHDSTEPDALGELLGREFHCRPESAHALKCMIELYVRAAFLIPIMVDELIRASTPLGEVEPFEYHTGNTIGEIGQLAARTRNPDYVAKMLEFDGTRCRSDSLELHRRYLIPRLRLPRAGLRELLAQENAEMLLLLLEQLFRRPYLRRPTCAIPTSKIR
ncbi:hypothetical protein [Burkholderia sp. THE68]|uniref:hypothetical protein n=1 Tax=Burkholderia sp. THE68 TaxID=758782 RepID=UPI00138A2687|nr:hypothetical protein [Burkholderia sp. THE68]